MKRHGSLCLVEQAPYFLIPLQWNQSLFHFLQAPFAFFQPQRHFLQAHLHLLQRDWIIDIGLLILQSSLDHRRLMRHHHRFRVVRPHGITWTPPEEACAGHRSTTSAQLPYHSKRLTVHVLYSLHCSTAIDRHLCPIHSFYTSRNFKIYEISV